MSATSKPGQGGPTPETAATAAFLEGQEITTTGCGRCGTEISGVNGRYACGVCGWVNSWTEGHSPLPTAEDDVTGHGLTTPSGNRAMGRTDRAGRVIAAPPATVYGALLDRESVEAWLPPDGMRGRIERWDPRPGGGFRMVLTYLDPTGDPGKTSTATDVVDVAFTALVPAERVVQRAVFEADDPAYAGVMTMTWQLTATTAGTEVSVTATDVPPGIDQTAHEAGIASSLANLASHVETAGRRGADGGGPR